MGMFNIFTKRNTCFHDYIEQFRSASRRFIYYKCDMCGQTALTIRRECVYEQEISQESYNRAEERLKNNLAKMSEEELRERNKEYLEQKFASLGMDLIDDGMSSDEILHLLYSEYTE